VICHELAIEQCISADPQSRDEPRQRDFGRIGGARKHAFAAKGTPHRQAVKAAHQFVTAPTFHAVRHAFAVQVNEGGFDVGIDPCCIAIGCRLGAGCDNLRKVGVAGDAKCIAANRFSQRPRKTETIQR
jgi:hypothetical protein